MNKLIYKLLTFVFIILLGMPYASQAEAPWDDAKIEKVCPEEFAERILLRAKRKPPRNVVIVSRPALRKQLLEMERDDQAAREIFIETMKATVGELPVDSPAVLAVAHVDDINLSKLRHIVAQDGFPKVDMVGLDGVNAAFLLTQHADSDPVFQARMLLIFSHRLHTGEINGDQYALLTDRVLRAQGKKQRYGTQFDSEAGQLAPQPMEDELQVDQRRHALGLTSMKNYSCVIHAVYGNEALK